MSVTPIYAGILTLVFVFLSARVIGMRRAERISLGDGGQQLMQRRIRAHGNFAEYTPLALLLMAMAEMQNLPDWAIHLLGITLLVGRILHATGISRGLLQARVAGMALTFTTLVAAALANLMLPLDLTAIFSPGS